MSIACLRSHHSLLSQPAPPHHFAIHDSFLKMATLSDLPPEVLVHCLAYTGEVKTVVSSRAWDSHFRALFAANAEPLFAALARMKGWTQYQSAGDASQVCL